MLTAVGESKPEEVSEGLSQGTLESAPLSASSTARGIDIFFKDSEYEIYYNNKIRIPCMSYQDDIMRSSKSLEETQAGVTKLESMAESKLLTFNDKKSFLIFTGNKNKIKEMEKVFDENPVLLYGNPMKRETQGKYLGEIVASNTTESVVATIKKRKGNVLQAISDIVAVISDVRAKSIGGISLAIDLWELCIIPYLLNKAGTWIGVNKQAMKMLD